MYGRTWIYLPASFQIPDVENQGGVVRGAHAQANVSIEETLVESEIRVHGWAERVSFLTMWRRLSGLVSMPQAP